MVHGAHNTYLAVPINIPNDTLNIDYLPVAGRQIPKITHIEEAVMLHQVLRELHQDWTF